MGTTKNRPAARCLDLTRLVSRVGRGPWTGIDRVEYEYLIRLLADDIPLFAIIKLKRGFAMLEPAVMSTLVAHLSGELGWGSNGLLAPLKMRVPVRSRARLVVRKLAKRCIRSGRLSRDLAKVLPAGTSYVNVGHSNLSDEVFSAFKQLEKVHITAMIHDTIPLGFPEFQREGVPELFRRKLRVAMDFADLCLCPSSQTQRDVQSYFGDKLCPINVTPLGVRLARPDAGQLPKSVMAQRPYFVTIGTIEPRKQHGFLLDIWARLASHPNAPRLIIAGQRGWRNEAVFARLDQGQDGVIELNDLNDGAVAALLENSSGLLFPSLAEGFGLPACEAAARGIPVICNNLSVFQEILGEYPIYAATSDMYDWETKIKNTADNCETNNNREAAARRKISLPTWDDHFNVVLGLV